MIWHEFPPFRNKNLFLVVVNQPIKFLHRHISLQGACLNPAIRHRSYTTCLPSQSQNPPSVIHAESKLLNSSQNPHKTREIAQILSLCWAQASDALSTSHLSLRPPLIRLDLGVHAIKDTYIVNPRAQRPPWPDQHMHQCL